LSGQGAFGITIYLEEMTSLRFANPLRLGTILDLEYAIDVVVKSVKPLDCPKVFASRSDLYIPVTDSVTGLARIIDVKRDRIPLLPLLKATAAIIPLYNHAIALDGRTYVDGGISCPVPVQAAIEDGCTHILALLTQRAEYSASAFTSFQRFCLSPVLRKWPAALVESFYARRASRYNTSRDIALGRRIVKNGVSIAVISPVGDSPRLGKATMSKRKLLAAKEDAVTRTRSVFLGSD